MQRVICAKRGKDILKAIKKGWEIRYPRDRLYRYGLVLDLESHKHENDDIYYNYLFALLLTYVKDTKKYKEYPSIIEKEIENLEPINKSIMEGHLYCCGVVYKRDPNKGMMKFKEAASRGSDKAKYILLTAYESFDVDKEEIKKVVLELLDNDYPLIYYYYGSKLAKGHYFKKDKEMGLFYYKQAISIGDYSPCHNLAVHYRDVFEYKTALKYIKLGIKNNFPDCYCLLAEFYRDGIIFKQDRNEALHQYQISSALGYEEASLFEASLWMEGGEKFKKNYNRSFVILRDFNGHKSGYYYYLLGKYYSEKTIPENNKAEENFVNALKDNNLEKRFLLQIANFFEKKLNKLTKAKEIRKMASARED